MTREEALMGHRKLWNEIANIIETGNTPSSVQRIKKQALRNIKEKRKLKNLCYCCEYCDLDIDEIDLDVDDDSDCSKCPVVWNSEPHETKYMCETELEDNPSLNGEWIDFNDAYDNKDFISATKIARKIANLPERR